MITFLIITGGAVGLLLLGAAFMKKKYRVQREIVINAPVQVVFDYLKHLKNQDHFNKWVMVDPEMKREFKGTDGTVGFIYGWNGNKKAGEGEQEIKNIVEGKKIETEIRFVRPMASTAWANYTTEPTKNNQTKLVWLTEGNAIYPMNIMLSMIQNMLGKDMDISLQNLKKLLEK